MNRPGNEEKKRMKSDYKDRAPDPGILGVFLNDSGFCYLATTRELKNLINKTKFTLDLGSHTEKALQKKWDAAIAESREIKVLERIKPDKEDPWRDYAEDLQLLKLEWEEKLAGRGLRLLGGI